MRDINRRRFLQGLGAAGAATALPTSALLAAAPVSARAAENSAALRDMAQHVGPKNELRVFTYLYRPEVDFIDAALARLIPADELGPGARESGGAYFIDQQLQGEWGMMAKMYMQGPWGEGTPEQGYQTRMTPQEIYRNGIRDVDAYCEKRHGAVFAQLNGDTQDAILKDLDAGKIKLSSLSGQLFFKMLQTNAVEGFFADPAYGGNRDKTGWKQIGFPGVAAAYIAFVDNYGMKWEYGPTSLVDLQTGAATLDSSGHVALAQPEGGRDGH